MPAGHRQSDELERSAEFEAARIELARLNAGSAATLREIWLNLASLAARTLDVERVGLWLLVDEPRSLRCRYLLQRSSHQLFQGAMLRARDFPSYFRALEQVRVITSDDADTQPMTRELAESYLEPLGITSLLDAPLYVEGRVVGVVCHEHVGRERAWSEAECSFAGAVADNIARIYVEHQGRSVQATLEVYQEHLMELHRMEALGRIAAGIAHDFRGIVGIAQGFAELIRRVPELPRQADHYAQRIIDALQRGQHLSQEISKFGKDDPVSPRVLDVAQTIATSTNMFRVLLGDSVRLKVVSDGPVSRVFMDPAQLERALLNLVLNARDAMPAGGELRISYKDAEIADANGESATYVAVSVSDNGSGMDEDTRINAFKPFFTTKGEAGTGLGLAIVYQVISRAGGAVHIDTEAGRGTTITMYLPRIAGAAT
jgi:two-component system, cell cycle sensor histidine kinase and response regulator CckA